MMASRSPATRICNQLALTCVSIAGAQFEAPSVFEFVYVFVFVQLSIALLKLRINLHLYLYIVHLALLSALLELKSKI